MKQTVMIYQASGKKLALQFVCDLEFPQVY